jgi:outer membrane immunogenic protein
MFVKRVALLTVSNVFVALNLLGGSGVVGAAARAADLPLMPIKAPIALGYNWTGIYVGGNFGGVDTTSSFSDSRVPPPANNLTAFGSSNPATVLGGGQVGANYEFQTGLVLGAEAMFDWLASAKTNFSAQNLNIGAGAAGTANGTISNRWITTATGKVGFAWDRLMGYGKFGGAWVGGINGSLTNGGTTVGLPIGSTNTGWTAGAGLEWAFTGNWSVRVEYDFIGLSNQSFTVPGTPRTRYAGDTINFNDRTIQMITGGINYKFNVW